jgi:hypothetical protein
MTQVKEILFGIPLVIFVFWVFAAPLPSERIVRVCQPIHWAGNLVTSTTALASEKHTDTSVRWSDKMNYSCQYMVWRLLYQEDYNKAVAAGQIKPADGSAAPATAANVAEAEKPPTALRPAPAAAPAARAAGVAK